MSLKLEEVPFEFEGKTYMLRCNMTVLEEIQDAHDGALSEALNPKRSIRCGTEFLAAMLNAYAEEQGWPERYTTKELARKLSFGERLNGAPIYNQVMSMVYRAMSPKTSAGQQPEKDPETPDDTPPENSGN